MSNGALSLRLCRSAVRKGYAFPAVSFLEMEATPPREAQAREIEKEDMHGKAEPYHTVRRRSRKARLSHISQL